MLMLMGCLTILNNDTLLTRHPTSTHGLCLFSSLAAPIAGAVGGLLTPASPPIAPLPLPFRSCPIPPPFVLPLGPAPDPPPPGPANLKGGLGTAGLVGSPLLLLLARANCPGGTVDFRGCGLPRFCGMGGGI